MATDGSTSRRIRAFAKDVPERANDVKKAFAKEFLTQVVPATPVDTGKARSNWVVGLGGRVGTVRTTISPSGDISLREGVRTINRAKAGQGIHITNNLPYIVRLNQGWSQQAPAGFIERAYAAAKGLLGRIRTSVDRKASK